MKKRLFAVLAIFALVGTALFAEEAGAMPVIPEELKK